MQVFDPIQFHVPTGYIELRRALELTVARLFHPKYVEPIRSIKTEIRKKKRQHRWEAAKGLLLRSLRSGILHGYLRKDDGAVPLDRSHWNNWEASWRPFARDALGVPDASVYLLLHDEFDRWSISQALKAGRGLPTKAISIQSTTTNSPTPTLETPQSPQRATGVKIHPAPSTSSRKRGPKTQKLQNVIDRMQADLASGKTTRDALNGEKEEALASRYDVSRDTVRKARNRVLSS